MLDAWQEDWYAWNMGVDLLFVLDLFARLLTAYYDECAGRVVFEPKSIFGNYARGLLVLDLIASVPLTMVSDFCCCIYFVLSFHDGVNSVLLGRQ